MRFLTLVAALLSACITSADPWFPRQETTSSSSVSSTSSVSSSSSSASTSSSGLTVSVPAITSTTAPTTTSSTSAGTPASTDTPNGSVGCTKDQAKQSHVDGNYTGPVSLCGFSGGNNTLFTGQTQLIKWWTGAFQDPEASVNLRLEWMDGTGRVEWFVSDIYAHLGSTPIDIKDEYLEGGSSSQFRLVMEWFEKTNITAFITQGPIVKFLKPDNTPQPPPPTSFNFLGVAIGVPIAVAFIVAVLAIFCCMTKQHKSIFSKIKLPTRRKGYGARQSRRQRAGNATDDLDFDASASIYRDEPAGNYSASTRDERSARAMGVFSAEQKLHSTY